MLEMEDMKKFFSQRSSSTGSAPAHEACQVRARPRTHLFVLSKFLSMFHPILPARLASLTQAFFITRAKIIAPIINGDLFAREDVRLSDNLDLSRPWHCHQTCVAG